MVKFISAYYIQVYGSTNLKYSWYQLEENAELATCTHKTSKIGVLRCINAFKTQFNGKKTIFASIINQKKKNCKNYALFYIIMIYYHFNIPTEGPFRCADTHLYFITAEKNWIWMDSCCNIPMLCVVIVRNVDYRFRLRCPVLLNKHNIMVMTILSLHISM